MNMIKYPQIHQTSPAKSHHFREPQPLTQFALDYQVIVKGKEVISPAITPTSQYRFPLSNLDLLLPPIEIGVFFCYKKKNNIDMSSDTVVKTMKRSLAGILSIFYPLAGEIVSNSRGEPEIMCNNRGVEFVHARAYVDLKDLDFYHPDKTVKGKLVPKINHGVLSVQATELNCGSIIISCTINHQVADGYSVGMFLSSWAKYARFETISNNIPSFRPSILNPRLQPNYESSLNDLYIPISSLPPPSSFKEPLFSRTYHVRAKSIERIQYEASTKESKSSKLLSFTAFVWKLLAHGGTYSTSSTNFRMGLVVNGRRFLAENCIKNSSLFKNHFGNVVSVPYGVMDTTDLKKMTLDEVVKNVHKFVSESTNEEHFRGLLDWVELHRPNPAVAKIYFGCEDDQAVVVSSGQDLPVNEMDFGWGKPEFGSYHIPWGSRTGYISTIPSASGNGDWVVYMHLKQRDLDVIELMAPNVFIPLSIATFI